MGLIVLGALGAYFALVGVPSALLLLYGLFSAAGRARPWIWLIALPIAALVLAALFVEVVGPYWEARRINALEVYVFGAFNWHLLAMPAALAAAFVAGVKWPAALGAGLGVALAGVIWPALILQGALTAILEGQGFILTH